MPDLEAGARKEPRRTSGAPYPGAEPSSDGPEREAHPVPTDEDGEAYETQDEPPGEPGGDQVDEGERS